MSKTLVAFLGIYLTCLLGCFIFPPLGVWGFLFESNFHPPLNSWGRQLMSVGGRWSMYIGAAAIVACSLHWGNYADNRPSADPKTWILSMYLCNCLAITVGWAYVPDDSMYDVRQSLNWFVVYLAIVKTHANRQWMPYVLYIYVLSAIYMGWEETWNHSGGRTVKRGPTTAFGDNFVSAHMVAMLPIAAFLGISQATHKYLRIVFLCGLPFMANIIAHAQSRGAMLALASVAVAALLISTGKIRKLVIVAMVVGSLVGLRLTHDQFWSRAESISTYEEDGSATGRIEAWKAATTLAKRWPFGYGAEAFDSGLAAPLMEGGFHSTHSMPFELLVAWGVQGVALFYLALLFCLLECWKVRRKFWKPGATVITRPVAEAYGVGLAIVGMIVASLFLNRMRWELWWVLMAYTSCMRLTYLKPEEPGEVIEFDEQGPEDQQNVSYKEPVGV